MKEFPPFRLDTVNQCLWRVDAGNEERVRLVEKPQEGRNRRQALVGHHLAKGERSRSSHRRDTQDQEHKP